MFLVVQSLSCIQLFAPPWTAACQASLSFTISQSLLKLMSIESVMPSNHLSSVIPFSSYLQSFAASESFLMSLLFPSGGQSIGASAPASILPMNILDWFPLGLTGLISLWSKGLSRVFSNTEKRQLTFWTALWPNIKFPVSHSLIQFSSVAQSCPTLWAQELQHARPPRPSPTPGFHSNSYPSSWWCHPAISSSVVPFPPALNPSQHQSLFQWVNSSHEVAKVLEFQLYHHSFQRGMGVPKNTQD